MILYTIECCGRQCRSTRRKSQRFDAAEIATIITSIRIVEAYRSGHNEPHSKCGVPQGTVGSNPTASAKSKTRGYRPLVLYLMIIEGIKIRKGAAHEIMISCFASDSLSFRVSSRTCLCQHGALYP